MAIKALAFDTGGTILDWHKAVRAAFAAAGAARGLSADWVAVTNDYRRRTLQAVTGGKQPELNYDQHARRTLDETIAAHKLDALGAADRDAIWRTWHALDCWPDFPAASARMRARFPVVSFTILTTSLVIDVSRRNGIAWDAILSCEMIGVYKTNPVAYRTAAKWLQLEPAEILMVACHNFDLDAARGCGFQTAFVRRPDEWGPPGPPDPTPNPACTYIVDDFDALARAVGA